MHLCGLTVGDIDSNCEENGVVWRLCQGLLIFLILCVCFVLLPSTQGLGVAYAATANDAHEVQLGQMKEDTAYAVWYQNGDTAVSTLVFKEGGSSMRIFMER